MGDQSEMVLESFKALEFEDSMAKFKSSLYCDESDEHYGVELGFSENSKD